MARLEELKQGAVVRGVLPNSHVTVIDAKWHGANVVELTYKDAAGKLGNELLYRDREPTLEIVEAGRPWSFDADGAMLRLVSEAKRISLAHLFDPLLAIHTSLIEPLPHQITAVYGEMLPRQPLRFLLADDPGAGKTIMAGLLIEELVLWENTNNERVLEQARAEIARSVALRLKEKGDVGARASCPPPALLPFITRQASPDVVLAFLAEHAPPVLDPFCGGGSIPLEAQRLGLRAYASDLNPVAVLITKALIEIPPKFAGRPPVNPQTQSPLFGARASRPHDEAGETPALPARTPSSLLPSPWRGAQGLAEDVRHYGHWMRDEAERRIGHLYPKVKVTPAMAAERPDLKSYVGQELTVIAWLWARTVKCPNPACGARMPLVRSFALSTKSGKEAWVQPVVEGKSEKETFDAGGTPALRFEVKTGKGTPPEPPKIGRGAKFRCLACDQKADDQHIKDEGTAKRMGAQLMAIVAEGQRGRVYLPASEDQIEVARTATPPWAPDEELPFDPRAIWCTLYGLKTYRDLFTPRQLVALTTFCELVGEARQRVYRDACRRSAGVPPALSERSAQGSVGVPPASPFRDPSSAVPPAPRATDTPAREGEKDSNAGGPPALREPRGWHSRGYLPHFDGGEIVQSITFRLADALPARLLDAWREELRSLPPSEAATERGRRIDTHLDRGEGAAWLADRRVAAIVEEALLHFDGERYRLHAWVVMPNHVHACLSPLPGWRLSDILHAWKSFTAKEANRILGRGGAFWQEEYFDRYIRDERHFAAVCAYVEENPVNAGLCAAPRAWPFSSAAPRGSAGVPPARESRRGAGVPPAVNEEAPSGARRKEEGHEAGAETAPKEGGKEAGGTPALPDLPLHQGGAGPQAYADAVATYLAFAVDKGADYWTGICSWHTSRETMSHTFARQAIPMVWDYAECNPFSSSTGNWIACVDWVWEAIPSINNSPQAESIQLDSTSAINSSGAPLITTDPPYYDNIGYADLSDFFYVWLRRAIGEVFPDLFSTLLVPKAQELVATPYRFDGSKRKAQAFFETGLGKAFDLMRQSQCPDVPMTLFYAFKQAESSASKDSNGDIVSLLASTGWETMLEGLLKAQFSITGTWPMHSEMVNRSVGLGTNALASSIVLVCRPRPAEAPMTSRRDFLNALTRELPEALKNLQKGSIAPVDLAQAAIGPGMAVFSRYARVLEADGSPMRVRTALALINQTLDEVLAEQEAEFDADTRWALAWFEQFSMEEGPYGVAETLSKAKNTSVQGLVEAGILRAKAGKARLLRRQELRADWDPGADARLTVWEVTHYLIRRLLDEQGSEEQAANLLRQLGARASRPHHEAARDLAYRLYVICERKKWADAALDYNALVIAWPHITRLAGQRAPTQQELL